MDLRQKIKRLQHVPLPLWPRLAGHKAKQVGWACYEKWFELPFELGSSLSTQPITPLHLFPSDNLIPSFGERFKSDHPWETKRVLGAADQILDLRWTVLGSEAIDLRTFEKKRTHPVAHRH